MRKSNKMNISQQHDSVFGIDFHQFLTLEADRNNLEIAEELGISLKDVHKLKEKLKQS
ncbi:hypothetical protein [Paraliobacillus salinarum]|uniref:hypothetical protein n=1 Tax=Paraliobacillus salinarum TaxID=1158996 RepID=UPI0015F47F28|nr:hypothetical protein [Paraliobacillus salinarum]